MAKLLVLADDLTGATDAGTQLLRNRISSRIYINDVYPDETSSNYTGVIIDSETRHLPAPEAATKVSRILRAWMKKEIRFIYKKTDSTLRGPIGSELSALLMETRKKSIPFIPAFPDNKRFTRKGFHYVEEKLLHESSFGIDIHEPRSKSFIPEILKESKPDLRVYTLDSHRDQFMKEGINVFDCESNEDLGSIARYLRKHEALPIVSGASGFLNEWIKLLDLPVSMIRHTALNSPFLVVNGSLNERSLTQIEHGIKLGFEDEAMSTDFHNFPANDLNALIKRVIEHGKAGKNTIVRTVRSSSEVQALIEHLNQDKLNTHGQFIGQIVKLILSSGYFKTLVVFGGDTFYNVAKALHLRTMVPERMIEPGIAQIKFIASGYDPGCISKPGGFGSDDLIEKILTLDQ